MTVRTTNLELSFTESKVLHGGGVELAIVGHTAGMQTHRIVFRMGPSSLGYIAEELHKALNGCQQELDSAKAALRGPAI